MGEYVVSVLAHTCVAYASKPWFDTCMYRVGIRDLAQAAVDTSNSQVVDADAKRRVLQMPQGVFRDLIEVSHQRSSHSMFPLSFWRVPSLLQSCRGLTWGPVVRI